MNFPLADLEQRAAAGDGEAQFLLAQQLDAEGEKERAEDWLRRAVKGGHVGAMAALGQRLLARPSPVPPEIISEGLNLTVAAAHAGDGPAAHMVALTTAVDTSIENNWTFALAYLGRSAKAGHALAQAQLAFLAGDKSVAAAVEKGEKLPPETWHRLHDAIDLAAWLKPPQARVISSAPHIAVAEGFISPEICDWIIARGRPRLERAQTYNPVDGKGLTATDRTNSEMRFLFPELDLVMMIMLHRIAALSGLSIKAMEPAALLRYEAGQQYRPHFDFLDPRVPAYATEVARIGQRLVTFLVYLSEDFDGGETDFPAAGFRLKGRKGDAILFRNVDPSGAPDRKTLHAGLAPTRGEKWLLSQWIRGRALPGENPAPKPSI